MPTRRSSACGFHRLRLNATAMAIVISFGGGLKGALARIV
jgi:hypothetical protein